MRLIDEEYTRHPFYGARRLSDWLGTQDHPACREKVGRLMKLIGIQAIYPKRSLSVRDNDDRVYPYCCTSFPSIILIMYGVAISLTSGSGTALPT